MRKREKGKEAALLQLAELAGVEPQAALRQPAAPKQRVVGGMLHTKDGACSDPPPPPPPPPTPP